ncbi:MAG: hypothetical protein DME69_01385 [Verrucomicrobia bacterium]|nr:MAG: hypothetical protein DME69_01385 [Verrucomicrobiota bacterium]
MALDLVSRCKQLSFKGPGGNCRQKISFFQKKSLAEATDLIDRSRSLCEKFSPLPSFFFAAWPFVPAQPLR